MDGTNSKRTKAATCGSCGRDLVVTAEETVCPECSRILEVVVTEQWVT